MSLRKCQIVLLLSGWFQAAVCDANQVSAINLHRHMQESSQSDYDFYCQEFESIYGTCACTSNPDAALGVISTTAFVSCTPPNLNVNANFTSNERYLSTLEYCNDLTDTCMNVNFAQDGSVNDCNVEYVVSGQALAACSSCAPCTSVDNKNVIFQGFTIDCNNVYANASRDECTPPMELLQFDPFVKDESGAATSANAWSMWSMVVTLVATFAITFARI
ncbi:hypothetical protein MPSEU_000968400 [Mayamaea pseudoterrestris]|nr:hypothetical protein MPSEU_000968400 [Mayamaea pseudoterrestris]